MPKGQLEDTIARGEGSARWAGKASGTCTRAIRWQREAHTVRDAGGGHGTIVENTIFFRPWKRFGDERTSADLVEKDIDTPVLATPQINLFSTNCEWNATCSVIFSMPVSIQSRNR
jgi:hypothetical protein